MSKDQLRLSSALEVTARAATRLASSFDHDEALLQSGISAGDHANADQLRALDAFVQRFGQVFEHTTQRLFTALYRLLEYGDRPPPPRQLLIYLAEAELIGSARTWAERVELRNRLVHEYPVEDADRATDLIAAVEQGRAMLVEIRAIERLIAERDYLEPMS